MKSVKAAYLFPALFFLNAFFLLAACAFTQSGRDFTLFVELPEGVQTAELFSLKEKSGQPLSTEAGKKYQLSCQNNTDEEKKLELQTGGSKHSLSVDGAEQSEAKPLKITVAAGQTVTFHLSAKETGTVSFSYILESAKETLFFPAEPKALSAYLTDERLENSVVTLLDSVTVQGDVTFNVPFTLDCSKHTLAVSQNLFLLGTQEGKMTIQNKENTLTANEILIDAPQWEVEITDPPQALQGEEAEYYADVKALNGKPLDNSRIPVNSTEKWARLWDQTQYPKLKEQVTVVCTGDFTLSTEGEAFSTDLPVSLTLSEKTQVGNAAIYIATRQQGGIQIDVGKNTADFLWIDAPFCDVTWLGSAPPDEAYFFERMNVQSYNGKKQSDLGGTGNGQIEAMFLSPKSNNGLKETIHWAISGNILTGYYGHAVPLAALQKARPDVQTSEGSAVFTQATGGTVDLTKETTCIVTDKTGLKRTYLVRTVKRTYDIPTVYLTTENAKSITSKEIYQSGTFSMQVPAGSDFAPVAQRTIQIKGRGNSTWEWAKKPYRIKFDQKTSLFGRPESKNWILLANYVDRSLIRNQVAMKMAETLDKLPFVTAYEAVDVYLNGVYQGVYSLGERIEVKSSRIDLEVSTADDTGYLLEVGGSDDGDALNKDYFHAGSLRFIKIHSPESEAITPSQLQFIRDYMTKADKAVTSLSGYEAYIDIPSLIDWFLHHELTYNLDSGFRRSCYFTKESGGKLKMGPPWDFDLAFGNFANDHGRYTSWASVGSTDKDSYIKVTWANHLLQDPSFTRQLKARWKQVGQKMLDAALEEIARSEKILTNSQAENFKVWNIMGKKLAFESSRTIRITTYQGQLDYLKSFLRSRKAWMDQTIAALK